MADFDETKPDGAAAINIGDDTIRQNMTAIRERLEKEHYFPDNGDASRQGTHQFKVDTLAGLASTVQHEGNLGFASDWGAIAYHDGTSIVLIGKLIGEIVWLSGPTPPANARVVPADGRELSQATYSLYWNVLGQSGLYDNNPNGLPAPQAGNFRAPDLRGHSPIGFWTGGDGDSEYSVGGAFYGIKKHILKNTEAPTVTVDNFTGKTGAPSGPNQSAGTEGSQTLYPNLTHDHNMDHGHAATTAETASAGHETRHPVMTLYPFVYVGV